MSKRPLKPEERQLWQRVTRDVAPLGPPASENFAAELARAAAHHAAPDLTGKPGGKKAGSAPKSALVPVTLTGRLDAGDPKQARRVARGKTAIDATIDLHGLTQEQAFTALQNFLMIARARGNTTLLIITGKGAPETLDGPLHQVGRGILRRRFLQWVDGPLADNISSVRQAHQRHGGAGAFYVFVKKDRQRL